MTEDDILRAAMQVGLVFELPPDKLFAFAALIAAHEREACIDIVAMHGGSVEIEAAIRSKT